MNLMKTPASMTTDELHDAICALCDNNTDDARYLALRAEHDRRPRLVGMAAFLAAKKASR